MKLLSAIVLSAVCGFISLSYELVWFRVYFIAKGALASCFAVLLGAYLLALAFGSLGSQWLCRDDQQDVSRYLRLIADVLALAYVVAFLSVPAFGWYCSVEYQQSRLPWLAFPAALIGAAFPLIVHFSVPPGRRSGAGLSYLYLANILGSAAGTLLTGFWLMDIWSIQQISVFVLLLGLSISAALYASCRLSPHALWVRLSLLISLGAAGWLSATSLFDRIYEKVQLGTKYVPTYRFAEVLENRNGVITITPDKAVYCSGTYDGGINLSPKKPDQNQILRAYAVSALHPNPREILMIGLSIGAWAQVLANHPQVQRLTIVEINPGYLRLIPKFPEVASLLHNPKVEILIDDGRRWLARNPNRHFDLIVFNIGAHWIASSAHVLSQEFLQLVRSHLSPGGVYYFNTTGSARAQRTAALVFKDAHRILQWIAASDSPIEFGVERLRKALWEYRIDGQRLFSSASNEDRAEVDRIAFELEYQHEPKDRILLRTSRLPPITDDNMGYEWNDAI